MPREMRVAGRVVGDPFKELAEYGQRYWDTVARYDLAGAADPVALSAAEVARTRVIGSRISNAQSNWFVRRSITAPWDLVPPSVSLADADPALDDGLYTAANALYEHFRSDAPTGIARAKIHKVLHLKRPGLIPVLDSHLLRSYATPATEAARRYPQLGATRLYWAAIREDLIDETNAAVLGQVRGALASHDEPRVQAVSRLTDLRLLDVVAWRTA
ncbi:DUF6308 family protein [Promicromonospora thailandica]|uniref:DUF6308 family protein n=1 Tax=Promicromonospora thailandica TaxID=765201 RepID=UPI0020A4067D|nr:DUF6308 family protein [Promicromonospora thailandica]